MNHGLKKKVNSLGLGKYVIRNIFSQNAEAHKIKNSAYISLLEESLLLFS
jgi:hypothetical protein